MTIGHSIGWILGLSLVLGAPALPLLLPQRAEGQAVELEEADRLQEQAKQLNKEGRYAEAISLVEKAVSILEKAIKPDHPNVAASLNNLAGHYDSQGLYGKAEPLYRRSLAILEKAFGPDHPDVATSLNNLAELYRNQGLYGKAEPLYRRSLAIREKAFGPVHPDVATSLNNLAVLHYFQGQNGKAEPLYRRSLAIREKAFGPVHPDVATSLNNLAELYRNQGLHGKAEPLYRRSLAIREKAFGPDHPDVATSLNNLAELYRNQGLYGKAEPLYRRSLAIREKAFGPVHPDVANSLNNLAELYYTQGWYGKAEPLYQRSLAILEKAFGPDHPDVATSLNNLAALYDSQGQYGKAEPLYQRSLAIREKVLGHDHPNVATSLNNLAFLYQNQGQYRKAESLYQHSLAIWEKVLGHDHPNVATSLNNLAFLYDSQGQYGKAEPLYQRSLAILKKAFGPDHPDVATSLNNLAEHYRDQGQYGKAEPLYQSSLTILKKTLGSKHLNVATSLNNLAGFYLSQKKFPKALTSLARGLDIEETNLISNLISGSEKDKREYLATFSGSTDSAISLHIQNMSTKPEAARLAFNSILRRKGRILNVLGSSIGLLRKRLNPSEQVLFTQLSEKYQQISTLASNPQGNQQTLPELEKEADTLQKQLLDRSAEFRQATLPVSIETVQKVIPANAAVLEFVQYQPFNPTAPQDKRFGDPHYAVYVLRSQGEPQWRELGTVSEFAPLLQEFKTTILNRMLPNEERLAAARALDAKLMEPVRGLIGKTDHLLIAPDGDLNLIPFAALLDKQNHYLLENYTITYLTSGRDLLRFQTHAKAKRPPLLLANPDFGTPNASANSDTLQDLAGLTFLPLTGTAEEATALEPLLNVKALTQKEATETVLKQNPSPVILHLATHGFFLEDQPLPKSDPKSDRLLIGHPPTLRIENPLLRSGLALAGANLHRSSESGILTALEVTGIDLQGTQLVVLSACQTGLGDIATGEGVYGLRRAFSLAGAESLVMSFWLTENTASKDLMVAYYQRLRKGEGRSQALRQVQLSMLKGELSKPGLDYSSPYNWAAFIPSGNWQPIDQWSAKPQKANL
jgi:CHAT domain-containing protein/Tfp pilus assembly protein PilF